MRVASTVISLAILSSPTQAFVSPSSSLPRSTVLRDVVTEENVEAVVEPEQRKAETSTEAAEATATAVAAGWQERGVTPERIEKATKERPYPLFLAEKTASFLLDPFSSKEPQSPFNSKPKENIAVLGTGWGAAAFLKSIDTDKYDVTVISPRNYFVFTPMLAGASVGSVDFKSITEPIREVRDLCAHDYI